MKITLFVAIAAFLLALLDVLVWSPETDSWETSNLFTKIMCIIILLCFATWFGGFIVGLVKWILKLK